MNSGLALPSDMTPPANYRKRYNKGEIKCKGTFEKRELTAEPKFVRKRRAIALPESDLGNV